MSRSPRKRPPAITPPTLPPRRTSTAWSGVRWKNTDRLMADASELQARSLLSAAAVRARAGEMFEIGMKGGLTHFPSDLDRMDGVAEALLAVTREAYPTLEIPFHARWRHFVLGGVDRWARLADVASWPDRAARARAEFDLAIVSVLLDAGAGATWRYRDAVTGQGIGRSEGLAIASLDMFAVGLFSGDDRADFRVDSNVIAKLPLTALAS